MEPSDSSMWNLRFRKWQFRLGIINAVPTGNLALVELLSTHFTGCSVPTRAVHVAASMGNHDVLQCFVTHREDFKWDGMVVERAIEWNHVELAQWLFDKMVSTAEPKINRWAATAAGRGNLDMIKWISSLSEQINLHEAMQPAVDVGHLQILEWVKQQLEADTTESCFPPINLDKACLSEHIAVVEWVICHYPDRAYIYCADSEAAKLGRLDLVKILHSNNIKGCSFMRAIRGAAVQGHLDVVKWLVSRNTDGSQSFAIDGAAYNGHFEIVKWLHKHTPKKCSSSTMDGAVLSGDLGFVQWVHCNHTEGCTTLAMDFAAQYGDLQIVQWLSENRNEGCTTNAMDDAAAEGHFEMVKWLHDNRHEGCTVDAMDLAARYGHFDLLKWLHLNRTEGCTTAAMDAAAGNGHLDVVQWLAENRSEGCTTRALDGAVRNKHRGMAEWLVRNRSEGGTAATMALIAARGDMEEVHWCHDVARAPCSALAAEDALLNGHFGIAWILHEHREWNGCDVIRALRPYPNSIRRWEFVEWMHLHHRDALESMAEDIVADL